MVTYEDKPVTRRWIICDNCGHSEVAIDTSGWWGIKCDVCGKEGCDKCLDHSTFWAGKREYHHHKTCKLTNELEALKYKYKMGISAACATALLNSEPDHIC